MNKRYIILLFSALLFVFSTSALQAQDNKKIYEVLMADKYFAAEDYWVAKDYYKQAIDRQPDDAYTMYQLGECYRLYFDYDNAEKWYKKAVDKGDENFPLAQFYYALMQKINGRYGPASENFELFIATYEVPDDGYFDLALLHYNGCILAEEELQQPIKDFHFELLDAPVNSSFSEYGVAIAEHDTSIIFTSSRKDKKGDVYEKLGGGYSDLFWYTKGADKFDVVDTKKNKFENLNGDLNEGAGCFNKEHTKFYFTKCDEPNKDKTAFLCGIYVSSFDGSKWSEPVKLNTNINAAGYWNAQPNLTPSGDTMYFVSQRPGGQGMHDIWMSVKRSGENWGKAKNLGKTVNTPYVDMSPHYYGAQKTLFFSSNGHEGFGGLDIFLAQGEDFGTIRNIGLPFNSNRDDFYFVLGENMGYLSSNRDGGKGNDDIYQFSTQDKDLLEEIFNEVEEEGLISISGYIKDEDQLPVEGVVVILKNADTEEILKYTKTDEEGFFIFNALDPKLNYKVELEDSDLPYTLEEFTNRDEIIPEVTETGDDGGDTGDDGGDTGDDGSDTGDDGSDSGGDDGDNNLTKVYTGGRMLFENIYFDFDKSKIRKEARKTLNELKDFFESNPGIKIEVKANTDSRGSTMYNIALAKRRGEAAIDYLVKKGLKESDFVVVANGEGSPIASNGNEAGRQLNRRVEFYIVGGTKGKFETRTMTYVAQAGDNVESVAKRFNMSVDELKELNDLETMMLQANTPVRVRRGPNDNNIAPVTLAMVGKPSLLTNYDPSNIYTPDGVAMSDVGSPTSSPFNDGVQYGRDNGSGWYKVLPNNTLYSVAKIFGVSVKHIREWNKLKSDKLEPGTLLQVSANPGNPNMTAYTGRGSDVSVSVQEGKIINIDGKTKYVVKEGDTFYTVCREFNMEFEQMRKLNGLKNYLLKPGMVLEVVTQAGEEGVDIEAVKKQVRGDWYQTPSEN